MPNRDGKIVVAISGYFNPIHVGHLEYIKKAKELGDILIVIVNNDEQVRIKGSVPFMSLEDRVEILRAIRYVDEIFISIDQDKSVCESLRAVRPDIFANGGDRHQDETPETPICRELQITMVDGLGNKIRSSSELISMASQIKK